MYLTWRTEANECPLRPNLYLYENWCEIIFSATTNRLSHKLSFTNKVYSEILDYALHYDLLQFRYDRSLYKVVSGAINTRALHTEELGHLLFTDLSKLIG